MDLKQLSAVEIAEKVRGKDLSACEVVGYFMDRCEELNPKLNAVLTLSPFAKKEAEKIDKRGCDKPLAGVPILLKDIFCTQKIRTTAGSKMLANFVPPFSATVVQKLEAAGAIVIGKCNQDEFAMGSSNETSYFGSTKNPWSLDRVAGGSSGGSAVAVAARLAPIAMGTDTGGSIRQPANFCGVFGIKPTYGRISRYGIIAFASSFDQAGPIVNRVEDARRVLNSVSGPDKRDETTVRTELIKPLNLNKKLKIGKLKNFFNTQIDVDVLARVNQAIEVLRAKGCDVEEVEVDHLDVAVECYYLLAMSEASSNLSRYDGVRYGYRADFGLNPPSSIEEFYTRTRTEGFGKEVKRRIAIGTYALSSGYFDAYFLQAAKVRRKIQNSFKETFQKVDLIVSPVTTGTAFKIGEKTQDPLAMYSNDKFTTCVNLAGLPAASAPVGFDSQGLPVGIQLIANFFDEESILYAAQILEDHYGLYREIANV